ncbi:MAG: Glycine--tRNA ligase 1, mitochondrial [Chaenotheca gracillima]|nr:MAG: Glycine--tRNA ligase 1, mitochondrial [Chaenotheca gracillima]
MDPPKVSISNAPPEGLEGNYNGWRLFSLAAVSAQTSQWAVTAGRGAPESFPSVLTYQRKPIKPDDLDDEEAQILGSHIAELTDEKNPIPVRILASGAVLPVGQLAIDRQPSALLLDKRHAWAVALEAREESQKVETTGPPPPRYEPSSPRPPKHPLERILDFFKGKRSHKSSRRPTNTGHSCTFCSRAPSSMPGPGWLFDLEEKRTIRTSAERFQGQLPKYDVLSYTWGRAATTEWVELKGIPWYVRSSIALPPSEVLQFILKNHGSRYCWVDIFCIPQQCPVAKAREVSRQGEIFRGAAGGIAWLHQTSAVWPLFAGLLSWCQSTRKKFSSVPVELSRPLAGTLTAFEELASDPWFQSTWALQEALLQPQLRMMGREEPFQFTGFEDGNLATSYVSEKPLTVETFQSTISALRAFASASIKLSMRRAGAFANTAVLTPRHALRFERLLVVKGLSGLATPTPAAILSSLAVRTSVRPQDKYYGIQAVFNLKMEGDYTRPLSSVAAEFYGHVWTKFAPVLSLSLNRPALVFDGTKMSSDTQDTLPFFSYAGLRDSILSCCPPGSSAVSVSVNATGIPAFISKACIGTQEEWRWEARGTFASDHLDQSSKACALYYGSPPMPVDMYLRRSAADLYAPQPPYRTLQSTSEKGLNVDDIRERAINGSGNYLDRTTRLLYIGKIINEQGHLGMLRDVHIYVEYYSTAVNEGHRVGVLVTDWPLEHRRVEGALLLD